MADVPWSGGPPSQSELTEWLVNVKGLEREDATRIAMVYGSASRPWTPDSLDTWLSDVVPSAGEGGAEGAPAVSEASTQLANQAAERQVREASRRERGRELGRNRSQLIIDQQQGYYDQANEMASSLANSRALGMRTDERGNPILDDQGQPQGFTPQDMWNEIRGLSFNMGSLNLPYAVRAPRASSDPRVKRPNRSVMGTQFSQRPQSGRERDQRIANASARRYAGQARALGQGGPGRRARVRGGEAGGIQHFDRSLTPSQALAMLGNMDEDQLIGLQQQLYDAGLYGTGESARRPAWGVADTNTRTAFIDLFTIASERDPRQSISRLLADLVQENVNAMGPPETGPGSPGSQEVVPIPDFTPQVMSAETLGALIDETAQAMRGEFASPSEKEALIAKLQERELGIQRTEYDRSVANIREQAAAQFAVGQTSGGGGAPTGGGEIDAFMAAISGQESGGDYNISNRDSGAHGKYQIMPANWGPWATRAGLGPNAPQTPQNQETVARRIMLDYYQQFGNWRDVAIAWYAGPGAVGGSRGNASQGAYPSINEYADTIMDRFGGNRAMSPAAQSGLIEVGGNQYPAIETFDPQAEAEAILKAQDPVGWEAHEFANRAIDFYDLLGGVAGGVGGP